MDDRNEIELLKEQIVSLEEKIQSLTTKSSSRYNFPRFAADLLTSFLVVSAVIFWISFLFVILYRIV
ncbi:hypothetical protein EV586_106142 [Tumebacillus sp. BK434]|nr:hypothetical protein EV586_106142 [Tumebacillus sp. BK434]